jgi:hypothetical protein
MSTFVPPSREAHSVLPFGDMCNAPMYGKDIPLCEAV